MGPEINKTVKDYVSSIAQLPDISKEARDALAAYKAAEVPIPPKLQIEISNAQRNPEILFKQFLKTIIEKGLVEYRMLLSEVSKINGEKFSDFKFSFETVNELLQQL